jgi:hypothetical protein
MQESLLNFEASNETELLQSLELMDIDVPPRNEGRTTAHTETWLIHKLIKTLKEHSKVKFPIRLTNREKPDFELKMDGEAFGVEITEVINPDYAKALSLPEAGNDDSIVDVSLFKWGTPKRSLKKLRDIAKKDKLTGNPWMGNEVEIEFTTSIIDTIKSKHQKYIKGYDKFGQNCLLIYHNQSSPILDYDDVLEMVAQELKEYWGSGGFSRIYIHKNNKMLEFIDNNHFIYEVAC